MREPRDLDALCGPPVRSNVEPWYRDVGPRADIRSVGWSSALNEPYRCIGGSPEFHFAHPRSLLREGGGDGSRPKHARSRSSRPSPGSDVGAARAESTARAKPPPSLLARAELRERAKLSAVALARCRVGASFDDTIALQRLAPAPDADRPAPSTPPSTPPIASSNSNASRRRPASARPASASASPSPSRGAEPRGDIAGFRHHEVVRRERARPATASRDRTPAGIAAKTRPRSALHTLRRDAWTRVARGEEPHHAESESESRAESEDLVAGNDPSNASNEDDDADASREHSPGRAAAGFATAMRTIRSRTRPASANDASTIAARRFASTAPAAAPPRRSRLAFGTAPIPPATVAVAVANPSAVPPRVASRPKASAAWTEAVFGVASRRDDAGNARRRVEGANDDVVVVDVDVGVANASRAGAASDAFRVSSEALDESLSLELELLARERSAMARLKRRSMARSDASGAYAFPSDCSREMRAARYLAEAGAAREALARVDASGWYGAVYEHLEARCQDGGRPTRAEKAMVEALSRALAAGRPFEAIEFRRVVVSVAYEDLLDDDAQALIRLFVDSLGVSREAYESWFAPLGRVKTRELMREFDKSAGASTRKIRRARGEERDDAEDEGRPGTGNQAS